MNVKYQVFVSSTYEDLRPEREQVIKAILEIGHIPVGMEMFSAADEEQWRLIQRQIDVTDYYIVIVAHRYGSMEGAISFTEKEYDYAIQKKVPTLAFLIDESAAWPTELVDREADKVAKLNAFKEKTKKRMVSFWSSKEDLYGRCSISLVKTMASTPRVGWVHADEVVGPEVMREITRLSSENASLRASVESAASAEMENKEKQLQDTVDTLLRNPRDVHVWLKVQKDWGEPKKADLLTIFRVIARDIVNESSTEALMKALAFHFSRSNDYRDKFPVPMNMFKEWIADLVSLDLIRPSDKRHAVSDTNQYWTLSEFGQLLAKNLRKEILRQGVKKEPKPDQKPADTFEDDIPF